MAREGGDAAMIERLREALAGRYRVTRELGHGGMATVFLADDLKHGRPVAIKVMDPGTRASIGTDRFKREIEIAARLSHPHIVPLFDSGRAGDLHFYVMPFVDGESLRAKLDRERQLPVEETLRLTREIAAALDHAHQGGLVHRDIKPENVVLSDGLARVLDFGIARAAKGDGHGTTRMTGGFAIGTPAYMSPEQAAGKDDVDARSDVYALACVVYEMLAGQPPFTGPAEGVFYQHLSVAPRPVTDLRPAVPRHAAEAIAKALAKSRADRFESAGGFAHALADPSAATQTRSVAVLPFANLSADPENEYFSDGIHEDVIAQLSKVRTLKVISRTSVMPFKKREQNLREIGVQLGVSTILEGSVRRAGDRVRVVAQLIDAESDQHLWTETYDRRLTDIFEIQSDVALHIAKALELELSPHEKVRIAREPTRDVEAYQLYLQGRHRLTRFTAESMLDSVDYFERAIERDPKYALAYAGIAMAFTELGEVGAVDGAEAAARARSAAGRALELDPELADAHTMKAYSGMVFDYDWAGAEVSFRRALELNPNAADACDFYARLCSALERYEDALPLYQRAYELDPVTHRVDLATLYIKLGRFEDAIRQASRATRIEPLDPRGHATLGWALLKHGRPEEGIGELERAASMASIGIWRAQLAAACATVGRTDDARRLLAELEDPARPSPVSGYQLAYVYTALGEHDRAMDCLERAFAERSGPMYGIKGSFLLTPLHGHPRFVALLKRMNLA